MFKLAALDGWIIVLSGRALSDELRKLPDSVMSFYEATNQVRPFSCTSRTRTHIPRRAQLLQTEFMMSREFVNDMFHVDILRNTVPKKLESLVPRVHEEIFAVFEDLISASGDDELYLPKDVSLS